MPYVGRQNVTGEFIKLDAITTSATNTFNLLRNGAAFSPATAEQCIVSVNGVTQAPQDAFNISGSQIVFTSTLSANDVIDYILVMGNALSAGVPSDGSVSTAKLANNSVDLTSKVTGTLPVANGGTGLSSGFTNGISMYNLWQLTSGHDTGSGTADLVDSTFTLKTDQGVANYGGNMTYSSGTWTFPSTGIFLVKAVLNFGGESTSPKHVMGQIRVTTDNSTYNIVSANSDSAYGHNVEGNCFVEVALNITNVSTHKFQIWMDAEARVIIRNSTVSSRPSYVSIMKIG